MATDVRSHQWAWGLAAATFASQVVVVWIIAWHAAELPDHVVAHLPIAAGSGLLVTMFPVLGAVILRRQPRHPVGWVMTGVAASAILDAAARAYAIDGLYLRPDGLPGTDWAAWFADWNWLPAVMTLLFFAPLLFPDGHLPTPRWRPVARAGAAWIVLMAIGYALAPGELVDFPEVEKAVQVPAALPFAALMLLAPVALAVALAAVVVRRVHAVGDEREQLRWLIAALGVVVVGWTCSIVIGTVGAGSWGVAGALLTLGPIALLPVAITVAIVKYRLYDIDLIINRTLVYGGLTVTVLGVYGLLVLAVSALTPASLEWRGSVLVVAAVAIAAYPLREWLQRLVNQRMYGDRDDPARAMSRLNRRLADSSSPDALLPAVAETIGQALRLPYVAVQLAGAPDHAAATYGRPRGEPHRFELVHQGEEVGTLLVGRRSPTEAFAPADLRVLDDVARQVAGAAHAVRLATELQRSRERLVLAREEERRRLRRDLHDGVGSALAGLALRAGTVRGASSGLPEDVQRQMADLEDGIRAAVVDIRRIVDDLRPPALDELGLDRALLERADVLFAGCAEVTVAVDDADLPAAVEVAAYRIATEAMTNAARHSGAGRVVLEVTVDGSRSALRVVVRDDGCGLPPALVPGVGLRSMRERAQELGGSWGVAPGDGGGTVVHAELPLPLADRREERP
jgi:two-component system NarL family sensor kinase